jgi:carbamoyltransferase
MTYILGISAFYHDSAACLMVDGEIVAAAQEERFTRIKHDPGFPVQAIKYVLSEANISAKDIEYIAFYDKPLLTFDRLVKTYLKRAPFGIVHFLSSMKVWIKEKLFMDRMIQSGLRKAFGVKKKIKVLYTNHHQSHASSAYFASPYDNATIICLDGVGEWVTTSVWKGDGNKLDLVYSINFPHSIGLLYSAMTSYCGFKVNSGEYKLMGLAPYGEPLYTDLILQNLINIKDDGSYEINMKYFSYDVNFKMTNRKLDNLFGRPSRQKESEIDQFYMDIAASIQEVTEIVVRKIVTNAKKNIGSDNLCLSGGVALNCVSNGKVLSEGVFNNLWIQPASGDAGGAIGAALSTWYEFLNNARFKRGKGHDDMHGSYLGPSYTNDEAITLLGLDNKLYDIIPENELLPKVAKLISQDKVIGWHSGRMEFGPRSLGGRSILGDPRSKDAQTVINLKIKFRESFRPFAPSILSEKVSEWFECEKSSDYMLIVANVKKDKLIQDALEVEGLDKINNIRSIIPSVTHVDNSARIQTVNKSTNPRYYKLIEEFEKITGVPILINTSFNVRGEPIVNTPEDAYRCFMRTEMDYLVIGNLFFEKVKQPSLEDAEWMNIYELD